MRPLQVRNRSVAIPFDLTKIAAPQELASPEFAGQSIAFWAKRLNHMSCPRCRSAGTLYAYARSYGAFIECVLADCSYEARYVDRT